MIRILKYKTKVYLRLKTVFCLRITPIVQDGTDRLLHLENNFQKLLYSGIQGFLEVVEKQPCGLSSMIVPPRFPRLSLKA